MTKAMPDQYQEAKLVDASKKWYGFYIKKVTLSNGKTYIVDLDQNIFLILFPYLFYWIPIKITNVKDQKFLPESKTNKKSSGINWALAGFYSIFGPALNTLTSWMNISVSLSAQIVMLVITVAMTLYFRFVYFRRKFKFPKNGNVVKAVFKMKFSFSFIITFLFMYPSICFFLLGGPVGWFQTQNIFFLFYGIPAMIFIFTSWNIFFFSPGYYKVKIIK